MTADTMPISRVVADPATVRTAAAQEGVVAVHDGPTDPKAFTAFLEAMGPLMFTEGETPVAEAPDLNIVTNAGRSRPPRSVFHSDTTYVAEPPWLSGLMAVEVPTSGGATLFTDQYAVLDRLDPDLRTRLEGARMLHGPTDVPETEATWHPLLPRNPVTNRPALYLTARARCRRLELADGTDASDLIDMLLAVSTDPNHLRRHAWAPGDVVVWDNRCTLHAADHSAVVGTRTLYRGLVRGSAPVA
ncbi:taurine catabolism dioxygenase [Jannaschia pagri]|uniref:Taurine catabolism dioxygenase n=1 Tax=Jannaschia pagri TaxID=2829797 RepID=A0ABQ4NIU8_9RHOB|nr:MULTISPECIES: TauD/TfdA family dioxygenase [unclassified Jannaschia]GIT89564.1 taurine catabolism dioxygenase [Jannaschia sp. AI_61]GIT94328.1 taurine catabolism dioxygenase [Jannaschia sp. AI_62]